MDISALAVDANIMVAAMIGGRTRDLIVRARRAGVELLTPERAFIEVQDKLVELAGFVHARIDQFRIALASLPVQRVDEGGYAEHMEKALRFLKDRDPDDAHIAALAMSKKIPAWSNDKDLTVVPGLRVFTTRDVAAALA